MDFVSYGLAWWAVFQNSPGFAIAAGLFSIAAQMGG